MAMCRVPTSVYHRKAFLQNFPEDYPIQKTFYNNGGRVDTPGLQLTKNDNCELIGQITKGLEKLTTLPTVKVKLEDLAHSESDLKYEIECRNVQERPPNEAFNAVKHPFLPCSVKDKTEPENYDLR